MESPKLSTQEPWLYNHFFHTTQHIRNLFCHRPAKAGHISCDWAASLESNEQSLWLQVDKFTMILFESLRYRAFASARMHTGLQHPFQNGSSSDCVLPLRSSVWPDKRTRHTSNPVLPSHCFLMNFVNTTCRPPWPFHPDFTALLLLLFAAPSIISEAKSFGKYQGSNAEVSDGRLSRKVLDGKMRTHLRLNEVSKFQANFYLQINSPTWSPMHRYHSIAKVHNVCFPSTFDAQVLIVHHAITSAKCSTH